MEENDTDEVTQLPKDDFRLNYFTRIVDHAIIPFNSRF